MRNSTPKMQHPDSHDPVSDGGLLVRLSGETVELVRKSREGTWVYDSPVAAISNWALDAVQRDIDAAEAERADITCNDPDCPANWVHVKHTGIKYVHNRSRTYPDRGDYPSDSTTRGGT